MMDTDTSVIQERIGQLCHQFKLPTMGAQLSFSRVIDPPFPRALTHLGSAVI